MWDKASQSPPEAPTKPLYCRSPHKAMQLAGLDGQQHPDLSKVRDPWINFHLNAYISPLITGLEVGSPCLQPHLFLIFQWMVFKIVTGFLIQANVGPLSKKSCKRTSEKVQVGSRAKPSYQWLHSREAEQRAPRAQGRRMKVQASSLGAAKAGCSQWAGKSEAKDAHTGRAPS